MLMFGDQHFETRLATVVARLIGEPGQVSELRRLTGGANKETWAFRARIADADEGFILQLSTGSKPRPGDGALDPLSRVTGRAEAAVLDAASKAGVPAPAVRAVLTEADGLGDGTITDFVPGETIARRILREGEFAPLRQTFAVQCGAIAARIHAIDAASVPFLQSADAGRQIELYRGVYERFGIAIPALDLAFRWAEAHRPPAPRSTVVHGDFRLGNLICGPDGIRAVLDWELAAIGDPMQDLGWLCIRTWRFGGRAPVAGVGEREDLFAAYERESRQTVDPLHVRFWETFGCAKWAVMCLMLGLAHRRSGERTVEAFAIGRRVDEGIFDFLDIIAGE